ncbi:MAG: NAD(P)-dependent alcohol dehydrogenase [Chloroflexota bacterium]|nr:NAD(P)-dependent alcohol dehydrogenase [Chloroflexota bacterium]
MKAIVRSEYGTPDVLQLEDVPTPEPGEGDALVRIRASSVNRSDLEALAGRPLAYRAFMGIRRPRERRMGIDAAGEVAAIGPGVQKFKPGDRVFADLLYNGQCAFAEFACAKAKAWRPIPDGVDYETAATLPASAVLALQGLGGGDGVRAGDRVLIIGASGGVGIFAVQIAKRAGAHVTGVASGDKFDLVRSIGADEVIDYRRDNYTDGDRRYDRVLDPVALRSVFAMRRVLADGGVYGAHGARTSGGLLHAAALGRLLSVGRNRRMGLVFGRPNDAADLATVAEMVRDGSLVPVIDRTYELGGVPDAMRRYAAGEARGKLVIRI